MRFTVAFFLALLAGAPLAAADRFDPEARAKTVAPYLDDQTIAVVHAEPMMHPCRPCMGNDNHTEGDGQSAEQGHEGTARAGAHRGQHQHHAEADLDDREKRRVMEAPHLAMR